LYCSGRLEEVHKRNDCSYTVCTEMVLQWYCLVCSTATECCSNFRHKLLDTQRFVSSNTVTMKEPNFGHSLGFCLHTASCNQLSPTVQVSVYTQLHVTNCHPEFRKITTLCSQIHTKHINTLCGQNVEMLSVKLLLHIVTTV
jgi:hypothetical protein